MLLDLLADPEAWLALVTLTGMEIILGVDNIVFISVLVARLPAEQAANARRLGLMMALGLRVAMLLGLVWLIGLTRPVLTLFGHGLSWRDIILLAGGLFLLVKATLEIHNEFEGEDEAPAAAVSARAFAAAVAQIAVVDLVFSVDSILTAIGMANDLPVMVTAVVLAVGVMYVASGPIGGFIHRHPTTKMLALAFLVLIGVSLVADSLGAHIPRPYIYFAMGFAALVETINVLLGRRRAARRPG